MRLKGKIAVVTGAGDGIGEAIAKAYGAQGAIVIGCARTLEKVERVINDIKAAGGQGAAVRADVSKKEDVDNLFKFVMEKYGRVDILANNAGITADSRFVKMSEEQWDNVININLKGVFLCGQQAALIMVEQNSGVIINTSSVVGLYGNFGQTNYAAAKFGVIGMTKTWAKELSPKGVRACAVAPGFIATPMVAKMPEKVLDSIKAKVPLGRLGTPEDIANAFVYLASDEASYVTGAVLSVDGGVVL
ncbi:MAG: 3-oxoacyl-[acyl-carrier-protein] reductase [Candidatus Omnitrophica bacterium]|nr:3-oxoacyl-[acyl-carrier-protein] reductase [Candidatus Omnitrophota bacterium]